MKKLILFVLLSLFSQAALAATCTTPDGISYNDPTPAECGSVYCGSFWDDCGNPLDCGECSDAQNTCQYNHCCAPGQVYGSEGWCCVPQTCEQAGFQCGGAHGESNCGATIVCGPCQPGLICNSNFQCVLPPPPPSVPAAPLGFIAGLLACVVAAGLLMGSLRKARR